MDPTTLQHIILGIIQGITEWLPLSSEGVMALFKSNFVADSLSSIELLRVVLFLHLGTFLSAVVYFRKDISKLLKTTIHFKRAEESSKKLLSFLLMSTLITILAGFALLSFVSIYNPSIGITGKAITLFLGFLLLGIASIQLRNETHQHRDSSRLNKFDTLLLGIGQSLSALPNLSRTGITTSLLLLRNFDKKEVLRISFLMSLPIILLGNIAINYQYFAGGLTLNIFWSFLAAFIVGLATIHGLMKVSEKISFGWFVLIMGVINIASGLFFSW